MLISLLLGSVRDGWLSVIGDWSVIDAVHAAGREVAFVPSWFARIESRKQEFAGTVQGDFHVSLRPWSTFSSLLLANTNCSECPVEWRMASWQQRHRLGYRQLPSSKQSWTSLYGFRSSLVLYGTLTGYRLFL